LVLNEPNNACIGLSEAEVVPHCVTPLNLLAVYRKHNYLGDSEKNAPSNYRFPNPKGVKISIQQYLCYSATLDSSFENFTVAM
jgi:hypothetical protein